MKNLLDRYIEKKLKEFDEHPELNKDDHYNGKNLKFYILLFLIAILILLLHYDVNHPEINIFPRTH